MTAKSWPSKDPNEVLDYGIDWSPRMTPGETITVSTWQVPDGLTASTQSYGADNTTIWLSGGAEGEIYTLLNRITTSQGRIYDQSVKIKVKSK